LPDPAPGKQIQRRFDYLCNANSAVSGFERARQMHTQKAASKNESTRSAEERELFHAQLCEKS